MENFFLSRDPKFLNNGDQQGDSRWNKLADVADTGSRPKKVTFKAGLLSERENFKGYFGPLITREQVNLS